MHDVRGSQEVRLCACLWISRLSVSAVLRTHSSVRLSRIFEYCQSTADPFLGENDGPNPWQQSGQGGGGCTIL